MRSDDPVHPEIPGSILGGGRNYSGFFYGLFVHFSSGKRQRRNGRINYRLVLINIT